MAIISIPISSNQTTATLASSITSKPERDILDALRYGPKDSDLLEDQIDGNLNHYLSTLKAKGSIKEENGMYTITDVGFKLLGNNLLLDIGTKKTVLQAIKTGECTKENIKSKLKFNEPDRILEKLIGFGVIRYSGSKILITQDGEDFLNPLLNLQEVKTPKKTIDISVEENIIQSTEKRGMTSAARNTMLAKGRLTVLKYINDHRWDDIKKIAHGTQFSEGHISRFLIGLLLRESLISDPSQSRKYSITTKGEEVLALTNHETQLAALMSNKPTITTQPDLIQRVNEKSDPLNSADKKTLLYRSFKILQILSNESLDLDGLRMMTSLDTNLLSKTLGVLAAQRLVANSSGIFSPTDKGKDLVSREKVMPRDKEAVLAILPEDTSGFSFYKCYELLNDRKTEDFSFGISVLNTLFTLEKEGHVLEHDLNFSLKVKPKEPETQVTPPYQNLNLQIRLLFLLTSNAKGLDLKQLSKQSNITEESITEFLLPKLLDLGLIKLKSSIYTITSFSSLLTDCNAAQILQKDIEYCLKEKPLKFADILKALNESGDYIKNLLLVNILNDLVSEKIVNCEALTYSLAFNNYAKENDNGDGKDFPSADSSNPNLSNASNISTTNYYMQKSFELDVLLSRFTGESTIKKASEDSGVTSPNQCTGVKKHKPDSTSYYLPLIQKKSYTFSLDSLQPITSLSEGEYHILSALSLFKKHEGKRLAQITEYLSIYAFDKNLDPFKEASWSYLGEILNTIKTTLIEEEVTKTKSTTRNKPTTLNSEDIETDIILQRLKALIKDNKEESLERFTQPLDRLLLLGYVGVYYDDIFKLPHFFITKEGTAIIQECEKQSVCSLKPDQYWTD